MNTCEGPICIPWNLSLGKVCPFLWGLGRGKWGGRRGGIIGNRIVSGCCLLCEWSGWKFVCARAFEAEQQTCCCAWVRVWKTRNTSVRADFAAMQCFCTSKWNFQHLKCLYCVLLFLCLFLFVRIHPVLQWRLWELRSSWKKTVCNICGLHCGCSLHLKLFWHWNVNPEGSRQP